MSPTTMLAEEAHRLYARAPQGGFVPGSNQASVFGVGIAFSIVAIVVMALRLHGRLYLVKGALGADDCESSARANSSGVSVC